MGLRLIVLFLAGGFISPAPAGLMVDMLAWRRRCEVETPSGLAAPFSFVCMCR